MGVWGGGQAKGGVLHILDHNYHFKRKLCSGASIAQLIISVPASRKSIPVNRVFHHNQNKLICLNFEEFQRNFEEFTTNLKQNEAQRARAEENVPLVHF